MALRTVERQERRDARGRLRDRAPGNTMDSLGQPRAGWLPGAAPDSSPEDRPEERDASDAGQGVALARRRRGLRVDPLPALGLGVLVLLAWQLVTATGAVSTFLLPSPLQVARAFLFGLGTFSGTFPWYTPGVFLWPKYGPTTLVESMLGFALGTLIALPLGYGIARNRLLARALQPYLAASQAIPAVALAPLLMLWLGYDVPPVAALCALIVFFPTVVNTILGLRTLDRDVLDAARVDGAGRFELLRSIEWPLALPSILAGLRTSLTLSITGAVVGEFVTGDRGLGGLLIIAGAAFDTPLVFATLLTLALLAAALYGLARLAELRFSYLEA